MNNVLRYFLLTYLLVVPLASITTHGETALDNYVNKQQMLLDLTHLAYLRFDQEDKGTKFDKQASVTTIENNYQHDGWTLEDLNLGKGWKIGNLVPRRISKGAIFATKYDKDSNTIEVNIAFRGTRDSDDWQTNLDTSKKALLFNDRKLENHHFIPFEKGQVHTSFLNAYNTIAETITDKIELLHVDRPTAHFLVRIAGHSLGGALATICAAHVVQYLSSIGKKKVNNIQLETYASPRVFGDKLSQALQEQLGSDNIVRLITKDSAATTDIVPSLPKTVALQVYQHVGRACFLGLPKVTPLKALHGLASYIEGFKNEKSRKCQQ